MPIGYEEAQSRRLHSAVHGESCFSVRSRPTVSSALAYQEMTIRDVLDGAIRCLRQTRERQGYGVETNAVRSMGSRPIIVRDIRQTGRVMSFDEWHVEGVPTLSAA